MAIGCLASCKLFYLIFVPYWLWRRDFRSALWSVGAFGAVMASGVLIVGFEPYLEWVEVLKTGSPLANERPLDASWHSVVTRLPLDNASALGVWLAGCAIGVGVSWLRLRRETDVDVHWALVLTVMIILSPVGWVYYSLIPALPIAMVLLRQSTSAWLMRTIAVCSVVPPVAVVLTASQLQHSIPSAVVNSFYGLAMIGVWLAVSFPRTPRSFTESGPGAARQTSTMRGSLDAVLSVRSGHQ
jgi:alpha-1,2-mannosyltransferase